LPPETISWRGLLALGISGGLLPCPSALVLMLGAISLNRVGFGLLLIVMFSIGLASVLTAIGVAMVHASKWVARLPESGRVLKLAPVASAIFIVGAGLVITVQALAQTGLFAQ
jgi:nickel/cobalt exporter